MTEFLRLLKSDDKDIEDCPIKAAQFGRLVALVDDNTLSGNSAKKVLLAMYQNGKDPETLIKELNLTQVTDTTAIEKIIDTVIEANPEQRAAYKAGKDKLISFFMGQVMRAMKGKGNPTVIDEILKRKL